MTRDQAILVRPDGSVMFDSPASKAKQPAESNNAWHSRTVRKAMAEQAKRGEALTIGERIAPEERPDPKVRNAIRMGRDGKLTVDFESARRDLAARWHAEAAYRLSQLRAKAEAAAWIDMDNRWEARLASLQSEARRLGDELRLAKSVQDLIAIEPHWPEEVSP